MDTRVLPVPVAALFPAREGWAWGTVQAEERVAHSIWRRRPDSACPQGQRGHRRQRPGEPAVDATTDAHDLIVAGLHRLGARPGSVALGGRGGDPCADRQHGPAQGQRYGRAGRVRLWRARSSAGGLRTLTPLGSAAYAVWAAAPDRAPGPRSRRQGEDGHGRVRRRRGACLGPPRPRPLRPRHPAPGVADRQSRPEAQAAAVELVFANTAVGADQASNPARLRRLLSTPVLILGPSSDPRLDKVCSAMSPIASTPLPMRQGRRCILHPTPRRTPLAAGRSSTSSRRSSGGNTLTACNRPFQ